MATTMCTQPLRVFMVASKDIIPGSRIRMRNAQVVVDKIEQKEGGRVRIHGRRIPDERKMRSKTLCHSKLVPVFLSGERAVFRSTSRQLSLQKHEVIATNGPVASRQRDQVLVVIRNFLSTRECIGVLAIGESPQAMQVADRDEKTKYHHEVFRIENQLRKKMPECFWHLLETAWAIDGHHWYAWKRRGHADTGLCYPEIEFIDYDIKRLGRPGMFDTHVDNRSVVTAVVLLSKRDAFCGGINFFDLKTVNGSESFERKHVVLEAGDAIFFRGEEVMHGLQPVLSGRRSILQVEMALSKDDS